MRRGAVEKVEFDCESYFSAAMVAENDWTSGAKEMIPQQSRRLPGAWSEPGVNPVFAINGTRLYDAAPAAGRYSFIAGGHNDAAPDDGSGVVSTGRPDA